LSRLKEISPTVRAAIDGLPSLEFSSTGWTVLDVPIEEERWASREMTRIGPEIEILGPPGLRARMAEIARTLARFYGTETSE
jgi:predicted DNA-binding transcriptional regulator YafY